MLEGCHELEWRLGIVVFHVRNIFVFSSALQTLLNHKGGLSVGNRESGVQDRISILVNLIKRNTDIDQVQEDVDGIRAHRREEYCLYPGRIRFISARRWK